MRVVSRHAKKGWSRPALLQRVPAGDRTILTAPEVAASGQRGEVAWTSSSPDRAAQA